MSLDLTLKDPEFNFKMRKPSYNKVYEFEEFRLDTAHLMLYRGEEEISLAPKAIETLLALVERRGEILTKDELMSVIWTDSIVEESNLAQYLHVLRKTLGNRHDGKPFLETLRRRGYRFNGDVAVSETANGSLSQRRSRPAESSNIFADDDLEGRDLDKPGLRVHKRGNVLALADWGEAERVPAPEPTNTEHKSVGVDYLPSGSKPKHHRLLLAFAVFAVLLLGSLSIVWFRSSNTETSGLKGELTFLNLTSGEPVEEATISPDGNYFVYTSHDGEKAHLWLQQTGQASRLEITEPFAGAIRGTSFTPDSQFIYFAADENRDTPRSLYRVPTLGGVRTKMLTDVATTVSFSPDGSKMVFMHSDANTGRSSIVIASVDGKQERILFALSGDDAEAMNGGGAWSPDGKWIAYGKVNMKTPWTGACTIAGIDGETGETKILSTETWDTCYRMAWTRDSQGLVFIGTKANESFSTRRDQIYYLSVADGRSRRLTTDGSRYQYASLGVTERDEILAVPFNRVSQIWTMDAGGDSRTAVEITRGQADGRGGIAPLADGRIVYLTRNGDGFSIWLMNADGSDRKQLTTDPPDIQEVRAAPDGRFLVFSAKRDGWDHLYRADANGLNPKQLTFGDGYEVDSTVSPDGEWIVYDSTVFNGNSRKAGLWKISSDGGEPLLLTGIDCITPHFSPDGRSVSCVSADWRKISIVSVEDGRVLNSFDTAENPILNVGARWTPDGRALVYIVSQNNIGNLQLQPIGDKASRPLTNFTGGEIYNFAFSGDGVRLYLARGYAIRNAVLISNFR